MQTKSLLHYIIHILHTSQHRKLPCCQFASSTASAKPWPLRRYRASVFYFDKHLCTHYVFCTMPVNITKRLVYAACICVTVYYFPLYFSALFKKCLKEIYIYLIFYNTLLVFSILSKHLVSYGDVTRDNFQHSKSKICTCLILFFSNARAGH